MTLVKKAHNDRLQKELGLGDIDKKKCPDILFFPVILTTLIIDIYSHHEKCILMYKVT